MDRLTRCLPTVALVALCAGPVAAQPTPPVGPPAPGADEDLERPSASGWDSIDRPMMRALAYDRRDIIEDMLRRPSGLSAASAAELATDVAIPREHAERIVEAARTGANLQAIEALLRVGLPAGVTVPAGVHLANANAAALQRLGLSEVQAREFLRFRRSALRVHHHFREVKAIHEARAARAAEPALRSTAERVMSVARSLGLAAPAAEAELRTLERLSAAERAARRARLLEGGAEGARDPLASFRRADGTLEWNRVLRGQGLQVVNGVTHFAFAMFLKELAIVLHTGDRGRMEEFVDGLLSTDFFVNYGLFAAGATAADVAYGRFVRRVTRKHFLSGVLRSNLVLAAGLAVPMVARGHFTLDTYLIDVAALGLSATAVKAAVEGGKGVYRLVRGGRSLFSFGRLAGPVGWVYTAGEAAVVLLLADHLADRFDRYLDERALRKRVQEAQGHLERLSRLLAAGRHVSEGDLSRALEELHDAYDAQRRHSLRPVEGRLGRFRGELDAAGRRAHMNDTAIEGLRSSLDRAPALRDNLAARHGSIEAYLEHLDRERNGPLEARVRDESARFDEDWGRMLDEAYVGPTTPDDPTPAPGSRLALYDEETTALLNALDVTTDPEARRLIVLAIERVRVGRAIDNAVYRTGTGAAPAAPTPPAPTADVTPTDGFDNVMRREMGLPPAGAR
ncbi:MAG: hypothetical protein M9894_32505 [Planctomycetes bacterium]|nr:hypothetical protein [Planctomycetota bacterium]